MTTTSKIEEMAMTIRATTGGVEFIGGGPDRVDAVAAEWVEEGFSSDDAAEWWAAGAFTAADAGNMRDVGITPDAAKAGCPKLDGYSYAYAYCNGDCSLQDVIDACN